MSDPALLGREKETAEVAESLHHVDAGGEAIRIRGDAGIGKTSLISVAGRGIADHEPRRPYFNVTPDRGVIDEIVRLHESNDLRVIVERTFSLDQARQANEFGQPEHPRGKVVLRVRG